MGVWFLSNAAANKLSGVVGGLSDRVGELNVFLLLVAVGLLGGAVLWAISGKVKALMHGTDEVKPAAPAGGAQPQQGSVAAA
jgi:POT family proton-dependent oligopeptide transporter